MQEAAIGDQRNNMVSVDMIANKNGGRNTRQEDHTLKNTKGKSVSQKKGNLVRRKPERKYPNLEKNATKTQNSENE
jgi:hypothetical protein